MGIVTYTQLACHHVSTDALISPQAISQYSYLQGLDHL